MLAVAAKGTRKSVAYSSINWVPSVLPIGQKLPDKTPMTMAATTNKTSVCENPQRKNAASPVIRAKPQLTFSVPILFCSESAVGRPNKVAALNNAVIKLASMLFNPILFAYGVSENNAAT